MWGNVNKLGQGLANFFYKGPDSQYFRPCRPWSLLQLLSSVALVQKQPSIIHKKKTKTKKKHSFVPVQLYL